MLHQAISDGGTPRSYAIEPQRDRFKGAPQGADGSTCFEHCDEAHAENWALFDTSPGFGAGPALVEDFPTRARAEAAMAKLLGPEASLAQAMKDAAADVGEWRQHRARLHELRLGTDERAAEIEHGDELLDRIKVVSRRVGLDAYQLIDLVQAGRRHPNLRHAGSTPTRMRELHHALAVALAEENEARAAWNDARHAFGAAAMKRRAAEEACKAYGAQPLAVDVSGA